VTNYQKRWTKKKWRKGEKRIVKVFAFLPIICEESWDDRVEKEVRWLQTVYVLRERENSWDESWWMNISFATEEEYEEYCEGKEEWER